MLAKVSGMRVAESKKADFRTLHQVMWFSKLNALSLAGDFTPSGSGVFRLLDIWAPPDE